MQFETGVIAGAVIALVLLGLSALIDGQPDELVQEQSLYCEMVTTFNNTGGEFGWPDYKGTYEEACK